MCADIFRGLKIKPAVWHILLHFLLHCYDGLTVQIISAMASRHFSAPQLGPEFDDLARFLQTFFFGFKNLNDENFNEVLTWRTVKDIPWKKFLSQTSNSFFSAELFQDNCNLEKFCKTYGLNSELRALKKVVNCGDRSARALFMLFFNQGTGTYLSTFDVFIFRKFALTKLKNHPLAILPPDVFGLSLPPWQFYGKQGLELRLSSESDMSLATLLANFLLCWDILEMSVLTRIANVLIRYISAEPDFPLKFERSQEDTWAHLSQAKIPSSVKDKFTQALLLSTILAVPMSDFKSNLIVVGEFKSKEFVVRPDRAPIKSFAREFLLEPAIWPLLWGEQVPFKHQQMFFSVILFSVAANFLPLLSL